MMPPPGTMPASSSGSALMLDFLQSALAFILALGLLVTVHEFGHFWVARRLGIKILRFSIGFGKPLYCRHFGRDRSEFVIAAIPLGGYVKMLDEREGEVPEEELGRAFNRQPLASRFAVVLAGPGFNFLFAILAYWLMFMVGVSGMRPIVGEVQPGSIAARAGLQQAQEILRVDGRETPTWETVVQAILRDILDRGSARLTVSQGHDQVQDVELDLSGLKLDDVGQGQFFEQIGITRFQPEIPPIIGKLIPGGAARRDGLRPGDRIVSADGTAIADWGAWVAFVQAHPGQTLDVELERDGRRLHVQLTPDRLETDDGVIGRIGAVVANPERLRRLFALERYGPARSFGKALARTWDMSTLTLKVLGKMLTGQASVKNLSGPISIAQYAGQSVHVGLAAFLAFLGIVSVSLGVLNLLPVPVLDGGHLMYYLIELIVRRPLSESVQMMAQQVGLVALLGLMFVAVYNDIMRIIQ